jgi:hypothetical protein
LVSKVEETRQEDEYPLKTYAFFYSVYELRYLQSSTAILFIPYTSPEVEMLVSRISHGWSLHPKKEVTVTKTSV